MEDSAQLISKLDSLLPGLILEKRRFGRQEDYSFWIEVKSVVKVAQAIKQDPDLILDWLENLSVMQMDQALVLTYFVRSSMNGRSLILRASVVPSSPEAKIEVNSVVSIWPMAILFEKEIEDMFGISFKGNPRSGHVFLPESWKGFPLRKAYSFPTEFAGVPHSREKGHT